MISEATQKDTITGPSFNSTKTDKTPNELIVTYEPVQHCSNNEHAKPVTVGTACHIQLNLPSVVSFVKTKIK